MAEIIRKGKKLGPILELSPEAYQARTLHKILTKAKDTAFGREYGFREILRTPDMEAEFRSRVPVFDYDSIAESWWYRSLEGEPDVCWPGRTLYYALSSGTTGAPSKKIPITKDYIDNYRRNGQRQLLALLDYDLPESFHKKQLLGVGGTTNLEDMGTYYQGDLSGILAYHMPGWLRRNYKPEREILDERNWLRKIDMMVENAPHWDIGMVAGIPSWVQILFENIIRKYRLDHIHDIWPNLRVFVHGGVNFAPYRQSFAELLGRELIYMDTYTASEGYIANSAGTDRPLRLVMPHGQYFEFIPFDDEHFDADGNLVSSRGLTGIAGVQPGQEYALLLSNYAGVWRYLIGDTIRFTGEDACSIVVTGRTKHFVSICGEHLSLDNMCQAVSQAAADFGIHVPEFTMSAVRHGSLFAHKWYIGTNDPVDARAFRDCLDAHLCRLNDDYATERTSALKEVILEVLPVSTFYDWMKITGKQGGQAKFPRVLKNEQLAHWESHAERCLRQIV